MYTPRTGQRCGCKRGIQRDNCPNCEGTGYSIDFRAIHQARRDRTIVLSVNPVSAVETITPRHSAVITGIKSTEES